MYLLIMYFVYKDIPITVVRSELEFRLEKPSDTRVVTVQRNWLRAHRQGVKAYYQLLRPDAGVIAREDIQTVWIEHSDSEFVTYGSPKAWELIHIFAEPLPYRFPLPLALFRIPYFRKHHATRRTLTLTAQGAFSVGSQFVQVLTNQYPHRDTDIRILFTDREQCPPYAEWRAFRIRNEAMLPLSLEPIEERGAKGMRLHVQSSRDERIRISWG